MERATLPDPTFWEASFMLPIPILCLVLAGFAAIPQPQDPPISVFTGSVLDTDGKPVEGAGFTVGSVEDLVAVNAVKDPLATTDAEGRFRLEYTSNRQVSGAQYILVVARHLAALRLPARLNQSEPVDLGELRLLRGMTLIGRVRDEHGQALSGVRVVASDLVGGTRLFRSQGNTRVFSYATTDRSGIFRLPGSDIHGMKLELFAEGYYHRTLAPVNQSTPLEIEMAKSGTIQGRVLDPDGRPMRTRVSFEYEVAGFTRNCQTDEDGAFRTTLAYPVRYRIRASGTNGLGDTHSEILDGPRGSIELVLPRPEPSATTPGEAPPENVLVVKAVDRETGATIEKFRAAAFWAQHEVDQEFYREYSFPSRAVDSGGKGEVALQGPRQTDLQTGVVRVVAEGYAPTAIEDVAWGEGREPGEEPGTLIAKLGPESAIEGVVVDEDSGESIEGMSVWVTRITPGGANFGVNQPHGAVTTGDDGRFRLSSLQESEYNLYVKHANRTEVVAQMPVTLEAEQVLKGLKVAMASGRAVRGKLTGGPSGENWKVRLQPLPVMVGGAFIYPNTRYGGTGIPPDAVPVGEDGSFHFARVTPSSYMLELFIPVPPRHGPPLRLPLEPFRMRNKELELGFDISRDQPGAIRGQVRLEGSHLPMERLAVVATAVHPNQPVYFGPNFMNVSGAHDLVSPSGEFEVSVAPGQHALQLVDIATGLRFFTSGNRNLKVGGSETVQEDIHVVVAELVVKLEPAHGVKRLAGNRLEVRVIPDQMSNQAAVMRFGGAPNHDSGVGLQLDPGEPEVLVHVPPGDVELIVHSGTQSILRGDVRQQIQPLAREQLTVRSGVRATVVLKLAAPLEEGGR